MTDRWLLPAGDLLIFNKGVDLTLTLTLTLGIKIYLQTCIL